MPKIDLAQRFGCALLASTTCDKLKEGSRRSGPEKGEMSPSREIWEPFGSLRREVERLFEDFSRDLGWGPPATTGMAMAPRIDVSETESELKIEAELPGIDEKRLRWF